MQALIVLELVDSDSDLGNGNTRGKTRKWLKRRDELGFYNNFVRKLTLEDTGGFKEMTRMDHIRKMLDLIEPAITRTEIFGGHTVSGN